MGMPRPHYCSSKLSAEEENLEQVEDQVLESAKEYLDNHTRAPPTRSHDRMGNNGPLLGCETDQVETPPPIGSFLFGLNTKADRTYYYDANSEDAAYITRSILYMKGVSTEWPDPETRNVLAMPTDPKGRNLFNNHPSGDPFVNWWVCPLQG